MTADNHKSLNRRLFMGGAAALASAVSLPAFSQTADSTEMLPAAGGAVRNNVSSFRMLDWQNYFENTQNGAILVDITSRALHYWSEDQSVYRLYPTSVPLSEELTRRGRTQVVEKVVNPSWRPTPSMRERNPEWPEVVEGGSPDNPLGTRALYLSWTYYRIHGTHDPKLVGKKATAGCFGLLNVDIIHLYDRVQLGTRVVVLPYS